MAASSRTIHVAPLLAFAVTGVLLAANACNKSNPVQPTPTCSFTLSGRSQSFSSAGGPGTVAVDTGAQCSWTVEGASGWINLQSPLSTTGPGTVTFAVQPNASSDGREKSLMIAGTAFNVTQAGQAACAFSITPESKSISDQGGDGQVQVTTTSGCGWTATSNAAWITLAGDPRGSGSGAVRYSVSENKGSASRSGSVTIAGLTFSVNQSAENPTPLECEYSVEPVTFTPCMPGSRLTALLTTQANCSWTVTTSAGWLSLPNGGSGKGSGKISIAYSDNYDAPREGVVMVRWPTPTAGQNLHVEQAGCVYSVTQSSFSFTSAASSGSFNVFQESLPNSCGGALQDKCIWTARSNVPWITVTSSMPRQGDNPVSFTVSANTGASSRTGKITVRSETVTITQAAP
jgi:hypothetical protein